MRAAAAALALGVAGCATPRPCAPAPTMPVDTVSASGVLRVADASARYDGASGALRVEGRVEERAYRAAAWSAVVGANVTLSPPPLPGGPPPARASRTPSAGLVSGLDGTFAIGVVTPDPSGYRLAVRFVGTDGAELSVDSLLAVRP